MHMRKYYKNPKVIAAVVTFISGIAINLFGLVNVLHNYDDIFIQPYGYGNGTDSGRWLLQVLGTIAEKLSMGYNLPWVCGIAFLLTLSITVFFVVDIFNIKSRLFSVLIGLSFASFPTASATLMFRYAAPYYGLALLLAVLGAWVAIKGKGNGFLRMIISALLLSCSLGIYQSYLPVAVSIFVLHLIQQAITSDESWYRIIYRGLFYCACIVLGLIGYFVFLKFFLSYYNVALNHYKGLDSMGNLKLTEIPMLVVNAFVIFCKMPLNNTYGISPTPIISLSYILLGLLSIVMIGFILIKKRVKSLNGIVALILCLIFPISVNLIRIMCRGDNNIYTTLMVYPFVIVLLAPMVIFEAFPALPVTWAKAKKVCASSIIVFLCLIIFGYSYFANLNYTGLYYANRQTENYFVSMVAQIRMTDEFTADKKWAFLGYIQDPLFKNPWQNIPSYVGGFASSYDLINSYSRPRWIRNHIGYEVSFVDSQTIGELQNRDDVKKMPCWPDKGSVKVIDDIVVVKFQ